MVDLVPGASIIFDVGANVGQTARTYRQLYPEAEIYSFEPFPESYAALSNAFKSDKRFHPVELALSDEISTRTMFLCAGSVTNSLLRRENRTGDTIEVQTETIDHFYERSSIPRIDILKIDAEGAEMKILEGARSMFVRGLVRGVFLEVYFEPVYEGMPLMWDLNAHLQSRGFKLYGLYSLSRGSTGCLSYGNALYRQVSWGGEDAQAGKSRRSPGGLVEGRFLPAFLRIS